jgi:hypothetical protein
MVLNGQPAPELTVSVVPGGVRYRGVLREQTVKTDAKGEFSVKWPEPGMYAVSASYPPRAPGGMGEAGQGGAPVASATPVAPAKRFTYSGTLEVLPE